MQEDPELGAGGEVVEAQLLPIGDLAMMLLDFLVQFCHLLWGRPSENEPSWCEEEEPAEAVDC